MLHSKTYFLGIDGGGTRTKAKVFDQTGQCLGVAESGPANIASSLVQAKQAIVEVVCKAIKNANINHCVRTDELHVAAGLAGANVASAHKGLEAWEQPFASFRFASDLQTAIIGAHAGQKGALLIVGTGSCAASWHHNKLKQFGGHGLTLGDKGSGAWLGKQAVSHSLECLDGIIPQTLLAERICQYLQLDTTQALVEEFHNAAPSRFGELAPLVMQLAKEHEHAAIQIVKEGAEYLSGIARQALAHGNGKLALSGGVAKIITPYLAADVQDAIVPVARCPEWGAVYLFYQDRCLLT